MPCLQREREGSRVSAVFGMPALWGYRQSAESFGLTHLSTLCYLRREWVGEGHNGEVGLSDHSREGE